jgi:hypothetical protein
MRVLGIVDKVDRRDKRFVAPRRRIRLPWFLLACVGLLASIAWLSKRVIPAASGHSSAAHSTEAASPPPQGTDW